MKQFSVCPNTRRASATRAIRAVQRACTLWVVCLIGVTIIGVSIYAPSSLFAAQQPQLAPSPQANLALAPDFLTPDELPTAPPIAPNGRMLYAQNCAPCHGDSGLGDGPVATDLPGPATALADPQIARERSPAEWFAVTKYGRIDQMMPPWQARMTDAQIWDTVYYAWSLHLDEQAIAAATLRYAESCAACHGPQGEGDPNTGVPAFNDPVYAATFNADQWHMAWQEGHANLETPAGTPVALGQDWTLDEQYDLLEAMRTLAYVPAWDAAFGRPQSVVGEGDGVVTGRLRLATPGATLPPEQEVRLETYMDFEPIETVVTVADAEGEFRFEGLALDPNVVYLVVTAYDDVQYSSPILSLTAEQPFVDTEITLHNRTDDPTGLFIDRVNWVVEPQPDGLLVGQILSFGLEGERTYTGSALDGVDMPVTVGIFVPPNAQDVQLENGVLGGRYHRQGNLIYDTVPIAPGPATHQLVVRYWVPIDAEPLTLRNEFIYPLNRITFLAADLPEVDLFVPGLEFMGLQDFQGMPFQMWQGDNLAPGPVPVHFMGLQATGGGSVDVPILGTGAIFGMGGAVAVALAAAVVAGWRRGRLTPAQEKSGLAAQRAYLLQEIARLDDLYAAGAVDEETWQHERAQLKIQLLHVSVRLDEALAAEPNDPGLDPLDDESTEFDSRG